MAILNSFVNDIFERVATEASSMFHRASWYLVLLIEIRIGCILKEVDNFVT